MADTIHAMMITGKAPERIPMARVAVKAFLAQDYPDRCLWIINHGDQRIMAKSGEQSPRPGAVIREIMVYPQCSTKQPTLGALRNLALSHIGDGLVMIWDDDDFARSDYMSTMRRYYQPGSIVLMRQQLRHDLLRNVTAIKFQPRGHVGQSLFSAKEARYEDLNRHEDARLVATFKDRISFNNDPLLYVRMCHNHNVWGRSHIMGRAVVAGPNRLLLTAAQAKHIAAVREMYKDYITSQG